MAMNESCPSDCRYGPLQFVPIPNYFHHTLFRNRRPSYCHTRSRRCDVRRDVPFAFSRNVKCQAGQCEGHQKTPSRGPDWLIGVDPYLLNVGLFEIMTAFVSHHVSRYFLPHYFNFIQFPCAPFGIIRTATSTRT